MGHVLQDNTHLKTAMTTQWTVMISQKTTVTTSIWCCDNSHQRWQYAELVWWQYI